jgi:hypothetical protein
VTITLEQGQDSISSFSEDGLKIKRNGNRTRITVSDIFIDNFNFKWNISKKSNILAAHSNIG